MSKHPLNKQFFSAEIDWLNVWGVFIEDAERIDKCNAKEGEAPFTMRVCTGTHQDQKTRTCEGGISIDFFDEERNTIDHPVLTIRIPWETAKAIGLFIAMLPDEEND